MLNEEGRPQAAFFIQMIGCYGCTTTLSLRVLPLAVIVTMYIPALNSPFRSKKTFT